MRSRLLSLILPHQLSLGEDAPLHHRTAIRWVRGWPPGSTLFPVFAETPKGLVRADENVAVGNGQGSVVGFAERIGREQFELRTRFEHERVAGMVDDIKPAVGQH